MPLANDGIDHPVVDALRMFDAALGVALCLALLGFIWVLHTERSRVAVLLGVTSWLLLALNSVLTAIIRLGEPGDIRLPIRLLGNMIGLAFVYATVSMIRRGHRPL